MSADFVDVRWGPITVQRRGLFYWVSELDVHTYGWPAGLAKVEHDASRRSYIATTTWFAPFARAWLRCKWAVLNTARWLTPQGLANRNRLRQYHEDMGYRKRGSR